MFSRRSFIVTTAATASGAGFAHAQDQCRTFTADAQKAVAPEAALQLLKDGNARFLAGASINCDLKAQVRATAKGQHPFAAVVGCIDSRVPPELVFDQRIGDIFAARIAGNFVNDDIIASLEFATAVAGAKAIVVLGHTECGAIKGGIDGVKLGHLTRMLENFRPAIAAAANVEGERTSKNKALVQAVADANVHIAARALVERSTVLKDLVDRKELLIRPAMHDLATGAVAFL